ncbi:hypothetical protein OAU26_06250 [Mariniblastus sp.]|nr:hypothetical protein [Mariniblastus sp.]
MLKYLLASRSEILEASVPAGATTFTYHRNSALQALLCGFLMAALVEATVLHVVLAFWNHWLAIVATLTTALCALQIIGQIRAVGMRPIYFHEQRLTLRNGAFDLAEISIGQINRIELSFADVDVANDALKPLNVSFPASHNVTITLKTESEALILSRTKRNFDIALLAVDNAKEFVEFLKCEMNSDDDDVITM